jgi:hypothetical protein
VDTTLLPNVWEQLNLSYSLGVDRAWVVNVGDLKGNELPTQFFLDYAWNPERYPEPGASIAAWEKAYAAMQFGEEYADEIADILHRYSLLQSDRKPELMNRDDFSTGCPFSITSYREMERVVERWQDLAADAEALAVPDEYVDTYYQLVLYQVKASALMYQLRLAGFRNRLYAAQGRAMANDMAITAEALFTESREMAAHYNKEISDGKWNGFQTQPYLGYSGWQQPEENGMALSDFIYPELETIEVPDAPELGVAIDGSDVHWPESTSSPVLPTFSPYQVQPAQYIEVFNRGSGAFDFEITVEPDVSWMTVTPSEGSIDEDTKQIRAEFEVSDWSAVPSGTTSLTVTVTNLDDFSSVDVEAVVENPTQTPAEGAFVEANGYVSVEARNGRIVDADPITWKRIPDIGRTGDGLTPFPVDAARVAPGGDSARLAFDVHLFSTGEVSIWIYLSPRQNVRYTDGLSIGLSVDDSDIETINITEQLDAAAFPENKRGFERGVADNVHRVYQKFEIAEPGAHTIKVWAVDPTVVVQKVIVDTGDMAESYLGPPESMRAGDK